MSKQDEHVQFNSFQPGRKDEFRDEMVRHCCPKWSQCTVKATFDFVERIVRFVAFENIALTLLLVWTGLYATPEIVERPLIFVTWLMNSCVLGIREREPTNLLKCSSVLTFIHTQLYFTTNVVAEKT